MNILSQATRQITALLDRIGAALDPKGFVVDRAALAVTCVAFATAAFVLWLVPVDPARLTRFTAEHVSLFSMADSTEQRLAFMAFLAVLLSGAIALRVFWPSRPVELQPARKWQRLLMAVVAIAALVINVGAVGAWKPYLQLGVPFALLPYLAAAAVFIWSHRLPIWLVRGAAVLIVLLAWTPAATGWMLRIGTAMLPWVDWHLAGVFSSADMLAFDRHLFVDVSAGYGVTVQVAIAAALKSGYKLDLGSLIHLTQAFQAITLCLFAFAAWVQTRDATPAGRAAAVFLTILVAAPFLAMSNPAVLLPNQSGVRFAMLPMAALTAHALDRWPLTRASGLAGAVAVLGLLHNSETGIAILAGLGLGWLVRARSARAFDVVTGLLAGLAAAAAILCLAALAHLAIFGFWPVFGSGNPLGLAQHFAAGYGGTPLPIKLYVAFVILCYAGYIVVRALADVIGRNGKGPDAASAAIAGMLIAWAPYYVNRAGDWGLWSFLALFAVLLAPAIARASARSGQLAFAAIILLIPIPLHFLRTDAEWFARNAAMKVTRHCAAGLSLVPSECAEQMARATELTQFAKSGDVVWVTAYPYLMRHLSGLRPLISTFDIFSAARTEADLDAIVTEIRAANPMAVLVDGSNTPSSSIPGPVRLLHARIADRAGFAPCPIVSTVHWQAWLPKGTCQDNDWRVTKLIAPAQ